MQNQDSSRENLGSRLGFILCNHGNARSYAAKYAW